MLLEREKEKEKIISNKENKIDDNKIEPIDPTLNLQEEHPINEINTKILDVNKTPQNMKKRMSIELLHQMLRDKTMPNEEREKINKLIQEIKDKDYTISYSDLNGANQDVIQKMEENKQFLEEPSLLYFPTTLDYDIEFYKLGRKCHGLKGRYAIIKDGKFYSSDKPLKELQPKDFEKLKEKTEFLKDAVISGEIKEISSGGEWSSKDKEYRIRINYYPDPKKPKEDSSFFLYFKEESEWKEVELALYNISKPEDFKASAKKNLDRINEIVLKGKKLYSIIKILSVKNKIKKRKAMFYKTEKLVKGKINAKFNENFLKTKKVDIIEIDNKSDKLSRESSEKNSLEKKPINEGEMEENLKGKRPMDIKDNTFIISDFMPLISKAEIDNQNMAIKKSLNDMFKQFQILKDEIPQEIIKEPKEKELNENGISFGIQNGVQIINNAIGDNKFNLISENCNNARYIFVDKNKPEIIFKNENEDNDIMEHNIFNEDNIYEISNIIKNSNNNMNAEEENNLIILGPKINNDIGINYIYKNSKDKIFIDPESINIKTKTINPINNKEINGVTLQIYHIELNINNEKMKDLLQNLTGSILIDFETVNFKDKLLFGYTIKLPPLKQIESQLVNPKQYEQNIYFIEFNHQHFIPKEYFELNQQIIIEMFCIPLISFSNKEDLIPKEKLSHIAKYLSPVIIGYSKISLNDIKQRNFKYEIMKQNEDIPLSNSFLVIDGMEEKIESIKLKNYLEGKDYSIGNDSYIVKVINKDFIEKAKNNQNISEEMKNKYFNVCFDTKDEKEFLLRPDENMDENIFIREISKEISNEDLEKIKINKKYNYLPHCEKYENKEKLFKSKNLSCLSEEQKNYISTYYKENDWIYKIPELKVKILSKNLGIIKGDKEDNLLSQQLYCTGEENLYPLDNLNEYSKERLIPISENNFNTFDFKEVENINTDNYQWITSIKFNNSLQMNSFIKLLYIARQNINTKKRDQKEMIPFEEKKINDFHNAIYEDKKTNNCEIKLDSIEYIPEYNLVDENNILEAKLIIEGLKEKSIIPLLENKNYGFENSLLKSIIIQEKKKLYKSLNGDKEEKIVYFNKTKNVNKKKFNDGDKKIYFDKDTTAVVDLDKDQINNNIYTLIINLGKDEFFAPFQLKNYLANKNCDILEQPIYKNDDKDRIYACVDIHLEEKDKDNMDIKNDKRDKYEEMNQKYLKEPLLILKDFDCIDTPSKNNNFGLYEPNIFRRKILNLIHNSADINIDPTNLSNYDENQLEKLYKILEKECSILPDKSNFGNYNISNLRRNNEVDDTSNTYRKQLGKSLLKIVRHEKFMKMYRKNKWDLYLKKISKGKEGIKPIDYFTRIPDKKYILKSKEDGDNLNKIMYLGVTPEFREQVYSLMLDLPKLHEETRKKVYQIYKKDFQFPNQLYSFFANQLIDDKPKKNIIFSLIDNDSNFLSTLDNSTLEEINQIKRIAKSFFIWAELKIGLGEENDKYVYFIGLLTLTQQLLQNFKKEYFTFWTLIGLSKNIAHFHQKNPLFSDELNYINIYGLVTKLIMERHQKKIFDKFISLNIPPELFISRHLSTFFTDYFKGELMMRILDIIVFESSLQNSYSDKLYYIRILCAIPLTLFGFSEEQILVCKSVSEIESVTNDLFLHTFNRNRFIAKLEDNLNKFYVVSNFWEKWFFNTQGREWDSKRGDLENLMQRHFYPVYQENKEYLSEINKQLKKNSEEIINLLYDNLGSKLSSIKSLYLQGSANYDDSTTFMFVNIQIAKLKLIYNNENSDMNEFILNISFGDTVDKPDSKYETYELKIKFDSQNNEIINTEDLFYKNKFKNEISPKYIHFILFDRNNINCANFSYKIFNYEPMKLSKISIENRDIVNKYYLEFILFKYNTKIISGDDLELFNNIFSPPEFYNSKKIDEKLYSYNVSNSSFNKEISKFIQEQNNRRNIILKEYNFDSNMIEMFKKLNNYEPNEDKYNRERIINKKWNNSFNEKISQKIVKIIENCIQENEVSNSVKKWLADSNISFEEILYGIILVDKSIISVNEKLFLIFSIAQMKDKLLLNTNDLSIDKLKEMIYSLYKRFRIYFTKGDIERMIDFLLKDERLFNIKYAFVHSKNDDEKINELIRDKDYYEPKINGEKKIFEIMFDDISKELNIFLNHLNNHYNLNTFSSELMSCICQEILNKKDLKKYSGFNFDTITLLYEKDNIIYKRIYTIKYSPLKITEEKSDLYFIKMKDENDIANKVLCQEISNIDINNTYNLYNYINFDKFKEIFFKMPYLSDLFRVSLSYLSIDQKSSDKELDYFKVTIGYEDYPQGIFYFPEKSDDDNEIDNKFETDIKYELNTKIKISETVDQIISKIISKIKKNKIRIKNEEQMIIENLVSIYKIKCYLFYDIDENHSGKLMKENIGYFDSLYSCTSLKNKNRAKLYITFNNDILSLNSDRNPIEKEDGYCKIYLNNNDDFIWRKCKVKRKKMDKAQLISTDYKTFPRILNKNDDVVLAYDI